MQSLADELRLVEAFLSRAPASVPPNDRREIKAFFVKRRPCLLPSVTCARAPSAICRTPVLTLIKQDRQYVRRTGSTAIVAPSASPLLDL
jgi:hypothetical protein